MSPFDQFPDPLVHFVENSIVIQRIFINHILKYLTLPDLMRLSETCRYFNHFCTSDAVWKHIYDRHFYQVTCETVRSDFYQACKLIYQAIGGESLQKIVTGCVVIGGLDPVFRNRDGTFKKKKRSKKSGFKVTLENPDDAINLPYATQSVMDLTKSYVGKLSIESDDEIQNECNCINCRPELYLTTQSLSSMSVNNLLVPDNDDVNLGLDNLQRPRVNFPSSVSSGDETIVPKVVTIVEDLNHNPVLEQLKAYQMESKDVQITIEPNNFAPCSTSTANFIAESNGTLEEITEVSKEELKRRLGWLLKRAMRHPIEFDDILPGDKTTKYALKYHDDTSEPMLGVGAEDVTVLTIDDADAMVCNSPSQSFDKNGDEKLVQDEKFPPTQSARGQGSATPFDT